MGSHKTISASSYPTPTVPVPPPVADYHVTGTLVPDATCNYFVTGEHNGKPYYRRADGAFFIWWFEEGGAWIISIGLEVLEPDRWQSPYEVIEDIYYYVGTYVGFPTVSAGPH